MEGSDACLGCVFLIIILMVSYLIISWIGVGGYLALIIILVLLLWLGGRSSSSDQKNPSKSDSHNPSNQKIHATSNASTKRMAPVSSEMRALDGLKDDLDPENLEKYEDALKKITGYLKDSSDPWVRARAAYYLGETGDAATIYSLLKALSDPDEGVRKSARSALKKIKIAQRDLKENYETLICWRDFFKPKKIHTPEGHFVVCRVCGHSKFLEKGIKEVIGIVGDNKYPYRQEDRLFISMWDEESKRARNADIDVLWVTDSGDIDYGWALNAVYQRLKNDVTRAKPLSEIPVIIKGTPRITREEIEILQNFGEIRNEV